MNHIFKYSLHSLADLFLAVEYLEPLGTALEMFCFWAKNDLLNNVTVIPSLSEDSIKITYWESQFCNTRILIKVFHG